MKIIKRFKYVLPIALLIVALIVPLTPAVPVLASPGLEQVIIGGYYSKLSNDQTRYAPLAGGWSWHWDYWMREQMFATPGTLSNFLVELSEAPGAGTDYTFTIMKNASPTDVAVIIADTDTTGLYAGGVDIAVGDVINIRCVPTNTPSANCIPRWSILFDSTSPSESAVPTNTDSCNISINYGPISQGAYEGTQDETAMHQVMPTSGTFKDLYIEMYEDAGDPPDAYRWTLRKNGESTDLSVTVTADDTEGHDTTHEVDVAAGDLVGYMIEPLNTPAVETPTICGFTFVADIEGESLILGGGNKSPWTTQPSYNFLQTTNPPVSWSDVESSRVQGGQPTTLRKFFVKLDTAPGAGESYQFGVRVNGVIKISVTISGTDTTGSNTVDYWELSNFDDLDIVCIPSDDPAITVPHWGLVSYTAPPPKPTVTTQDATDILAFSATGNGNITALNDGNCDIRGFDWDTDSGAPYANDVTEVGSYGTGAYSKTLTDLPEGTTIYYRAKAHSSLGWGYGGELNFVTLGATPPTVATGSAASLTPTGATLQGTLTFLGDYTPVYVFFQYGKTTNYGTDTEEQTKTAIGGFNQAISGLDPDTTYHFRAVVRHGASSYVYGNDAQFDTTTSGTPEVSTGSAVNVTTSTATLQGTLNSLGDYSPVYIAFEWGLTSEYGSQTAEGTKTGVGGFYADISGLQSNTTYHFRARVRFNSSYVYGDDNTFVTTETGAPPAEPGIDPPDILRIDDVKVFSGYFEGDDQLYVISYRIIYSAGTPILDVGDYFDFQLLDGSILKGQWPVKSWDYKPGSIYLCAASAPAWGGNYRIKIIGNPSKWETPPECYRDITPGDWQGDDLTQLDTWVLSLASSLQSYYSSEMVIYTTGGQAVLSKQGGAIFNMSIPGLSTVRPNLFSATSEYIHPDWEEHPREYEETLDPKKHMGNYFYGLFEDGAEFLNTETKTFGAIVFGVLYLIVAILIGWKLNNGLVGMGLASPIIILGGWFGLIPLVLIMVVAGVFVIYSIFVIWVKGT